MPTAVVTDSTAGIDDAGCAVVPLHVTVGDTSWLEGVDLDISGLLDRLRAGEPARTSQPAPQAFLDVYQQAARRGAREIVSIHLSGQLSGTVHAAALAARSSPVPVHVVDSGTAGAALGAGVRAAINAALAGATPLTVARTAVRVCRSSSVAFMVDSLEYLRRGGRLGRTASTIGTLMGVRPVLEVRNGRIELTQMARSRHGAEGKLERFVAQRVAPAADPYITVHHLGDEAAGAALAARITSSIGMPVTVCEVGAVLGVHVGPGLLGVVVADQGAR